MPWARVRWGLPENIAADIRLVGPWCSHLALCNGPLRTSTCRMTRQASVQIPLRPTSAALADIRSQRTMPSVCGGALPASSALRTEPASVPMSLRPPGCSPTTDLARFGSAVPRLSRANKPVRHRQRRPRAHGRLPGTSRKFPGSERPQEPLTGWIPVLAGLCVGVCDRGVGGERLPDGQRVRADSQHPRRSEVRAVRPGCPNSVASSADGAADVDHAPAAQRSTSLCVIKRIVRSLRGAKAPITTSRPGGNRG
jgi:hypothetical protein